MATIKTPLSSGTNVSINDPSNVSISNSSSAENPGGWSTNVDYKLALMQNIGSTNLYLLYGTDDASTTNFHTKITPGTQVDLTPVIGTAINMISETSAGTAVFTLASPDISVTDYPAQPANNINGYNNP